MRTQFEQLYPWWEDRSTWREVISPGMQSADPAGVGHGARVMGNGSVFAVQSGTPFTRISSLLGPTYERDAAFPGWGMFDITLYRQNDPIAWQYEEAFRIRQTALLGTELHMPSLYMRVLDVVPPEWPVLLRTISVHNIGSETLSALHLDAVQAEMPAASVMALTDGWEVVSTERRLRVLALDGVVDAGPGAMTIRLPDLAPGEEVIIHVALLFGLAEDDLNVLSAKLARNPDAIPQRAHQWWINQQQTAVTVAATDPRIGDLFDGTSVLIASQYAPTGGIAPLAYHSTATAVEELTPLRWLLAGGNADIVREVLDARYRETCHRGAFAHRLPAITVSHAVEREPDWGTISPPPAWTAAAVIRGFWEYWRHTGDRDFIVSHFRYLRWLLEAQEVSSDGLVPLGGDEPFYMSLQRSLPFPMRAKLLPDPHGYRMMRPAPWGAAPAMALTAACEQLASMAITVKEEASSHRLMRLAARLREATENTFWLADEGYYAAAKSRVDGSRYRLPHLAAALAPFTTGYAAYDDARARAGLDESLSYLLDETCLPHLTPTVPAFPGALLGELLAVLSRLDDQRMHMLYQALLSCASPSGEFRSVYFPVEESVARPGIAIPSATASAALGVLTYLATMQEDAGHYSLETHLPPGVPRIQLEGLRLDRHIVEIATEETAGQMAVTVGNRGPRPLQLRVREDNIVTSSTYQIAPAETRRWMLPYPTAITSLLPAPKDYTPSEILLPTSPLLILTVDADSFHDWVDRYDAVLVDAAMPIDPKAIAHALVTPRHRRYDVLYLDLPEVGAWWAGLHGDFWDDPTLRHALDRFRELGGIVTGTVFIDSWEIQHPDEGRREIAARDGWIRLPKAPSEIMLTASVPWESAEDEVVELLLYAGDGTMIELKLNGESLWRRSATPEGQRVRIDAVLHPGDNTMTVHATRRPGQGYGFLLGIRGELRWNQGTEGAT